MKDDRHDSRFAELIRQAAPPARDPVFRIQVLERRERLAFRQRLYIMAAGLIAIVAVSTLLMILGDGAPANAGAPIAIAAAATAGLAFRHTLMRILKDFKI